MWWGKKLDPKITVRTVEVPSGRTTEREMTLNKAFVMEHVRIGCSCAHNRRSTRNFFNIAFRPTGYNPSTGEIEGIFTDKGDTQTVYAFYWDVTAWIKV